MEAKMKEETKIRMNFGVFIISTISPSSAYKQGIQFFSLSFKK